MLFYFTSMQALDGLFKEDMKQDKRQRLEERKKRLSEMLLKETKEYEVKWLTKHNYVIGQVLRA